MRSTIIAGIALTMLGGCARATKSEGPATGNQVVKSCRSTAAETLVGKLAPPDTKLRQLTGAARIRRIAPGDIVTAEYFADRATVTIDPASGRIITATCG